MANKTQWLDGLKGFATKAFAEKRLKEVLADDFDNVTSFIYTLPDGRFAPVVLYNEKVWLNIPYLANKGVGIFN